MISQILGSLFVLFCGGEPLERDRARVRSRACPVVKANYGRRWTDSDGVLVDRGGTGRLFCLAASEERRRRTRLLTEAAAPGTWPPSKTGGPRRRQDAGIQAP